MNTEDRFDDLMTEHLKADAPREAPSRLLDETMNRIADSPQRGRGWLAGSAGKLLAAAAVLTLAVLAGTQLRGLIDRPSGTSPSPSSSVVPSESTEPTFEPSVRPVPTPGFEPPPGILPPDSRAVVKLDGLRVREQPGLNATVVDTLPADTVVDVYGLGPTVVDDIDWYQIAYNDHASGYAAVGSGADRYLELLPPRCPPGEPDFAALLSMSGWERLACFGDRSLTVTGTYGCPVVCGIEFPGSNEPYWLAGPSINFLALAFPSSLTLHFSPESGIDPPPNGSIVRVTGHFSDPASTTCVVDPAGQGGAPVDPQIAELYCREQFVVDAYEIIGTNPDYAQPSGA